MTAASGEKGLTVLMLPDPSRTTGNPYLGLLVAELEREGMEVRPFGLRAAVSTRYDLVHVHWPESSLGVARPATAAYRTGRVLLALLASRMRGRPVLWTAHNMRSHERPHPRLERLFWWVFPRLLSGWLSLSEAGATQLSAAVSVLARRPYWVTPHGHYRDSYPAAGAPVADDGLPGPLLLHVGQIRAYKNVPALVRAFVGTAGPARLLVAGACHPPRIAAEITRSAAGSDRVTLQFGRVEDDHMAQLLQCASLVVLPYQETLNSGTALLALSFDRPVLLPRTAVYEELQNRVGSGWLQLYDGPITTQVLDTALAAVRGGTPHGPALGPDFDWAPIGRATVSVYRSLVA